MHIFFSGIGGSGIGPLSLIALQIGHDVSGSDKQNSKNIQYLRSKGIVNVSTTQSYETITKIHAQKPIDWYVYSSAVESENQDLPEIQFCKEYMIKMSKRDELINQILNEKQLKLIAIAGTHGKSTTTAMTIWLFKALAIPISYLVGAKISFGDMGTYDKQSEYFVYEADEYDRNFLAFNPHISVITGIDWDHPDTYPTRESYIQAFGDFSRQSLHTIFWESDKYHLDLQTSKSITMLADDDHRLCQFSLAGIINRRNAWQTVSVTHLFTKISIDKLIEYMNRFPGVDRRFEQIYPNLYTDYAHTPTKIRGALQLAHEVHGQNIVVVYEGMQNSRQHFIKNDLRHLFDNVKHLYIIPIFLAREDKNLEMLTPNKLRDLLSNQTQIKTTSCEMNEALKHHIHCELDSGNVVLCITAGTGNCLDEWLRKEFVSPNETPSSR